YGVGRRGEVAPDQGEVTGLDRDVGAGSHREPEVGGGERRGIVDAVTDHGDDLALGLESAYDVDLVGGQDARDDALDPDRGRDGTRCALVVTGDQQRGQAQRLELAYTFGR